MLAAQNLALLELLYYVLVISKPTVSLLFIRDFWENSLCYLVAGHAEIVGSTMSH